MAGRGVVNIIVQVKDLASKVLGGVARATTNLASGFTSAFREPGVKFGILRRFVELRNGITDTTFDLNNLQSKLGELLALGGLAAGIRSVVTAANEFNASLLKLEGTAKITGVPLDFLQAVAEQTQQKFSLSAGVANDLTTELAKLAAKSGDLKQTQAGLTAFLDLGAARGLTASETLKAVQQAILGIDEGTDKLFGANPSVLYDRFAQSIGTTAAKLTDAQKAQAILTAAVEDGSKVAGAYEKRLGSVAGQQEQLSVAIQNAKIALGQALLPVLGDVLRALTPVVGKVEEFVKGLQLLAVDVALNNERISAGLKGLGGTILQFFADLVNKIPGGLRKILGIEGIADSLQKEGARLLKESAEISERLDKVRDEMAEGIIGPLGAKTFNQDALDAANAQIKKAQELAAARKKAQEDEAAARKRAKAEEEAGIDLLKLRVEQGKATNADVTKLASLYDDITARLQKQNLTQVERLRLEKNLLEVLELQQKAVIPLGRNEGARTGKTNDFIDLGRVDENGRPIGNEQVEGATREGATPEQERALIDATQQKGAGILLGVGGDRGKSPLTESIEGAKTASEEFLQGLREGVSGPLSEFFKAGVTGFSDLDGAATAAFNAVLDAFDNLVAGILAQKAVFALFGGVDPTSGAASKGLFGGLFADGGVIRGPGGPKDDEILIAASNGEGVITAKTVAALGGEAGIKSLNHLGETGKLRPPRFADGGVVGAATAAARGEGGKFGLTVGLEDGLVPKSIESPAGQEAIMRVLDRRRKTVRQLTQK